MADGYRWWDGHLGQDPIGQRHVVAVLLQRCAPAALVGERDVVADGDNLLEKRKTFLEKLLPVVDGRVVCLVWLKKRRRRDFFLFELLRKSDFIAVDDVFPRRQALHVEHELLEGERFERFPL